MVTKNISYFNVSKIILTLLFFTFVTGCSLTSEHSANTKPNAFAALSKNSEWYEKQLTVSDPKYNYDWQILLARAYTAEGDTKRALDVTEQMRQAAITPLQGNEADIVEAQIRARLGNYAKAENLLSSVNILSLPDETASFYYALLAKVQMNMNKNIDAGYSYIKLADYVNAENKQEAYSRASLSFSKATNKELVNAYKANKDTFQRGFLEYALIQNNGNAQSKDRLMKRFIKKYPDHVCLKLQETIKQENADSNNGTVSNAQSQNQIVGNGDTIAVFIPLTGKYAPIVGEPIKMGLLNAYKDRGISLNLKFYDTEKTPIKDLYNEALKDKAKVIIGPIIKQNVDLLISLKPTIPVIALNEASTNYNNQTYYLTLAPEQEVNNAVEKMISDQITTPMVIVAKNQKGVRISEAFNKEWYRINQKNVSACYFTDVNSLAKTLNDCYNANNTQNKVFDGAYIYGTANEASIIRETSKKFLKVLPNYYLTGKSNSGIINSSALNSISGMNLGDQPWLFKESDTKKQILGILPKANGDTLRCFAIGYDALNLALHLQNIDKSQMFIQGLSGDISINEDGILTRKLSWIKVGNK